MKVSTILDSIDLGSMALPEFQRGYVWNRNQVRDLMYSLYRRYPVGSLLIWTTKTDTAEVRGDGKLSAGSVKLILDGQQRITSLYGMIRGVIPPFFDGNANNFTGLFFDLEEEKFEFYTSKMKDNPLWVDVTKLMKGGLGRFVRRVDKFSESERQADEYADRLTALYNIRDVDLHIEEVTGEDKSVDVVVDIFNRVNSGGTKLSKGDLALARICARWPEARAELRARMDKWTRAGFYFKQDWLLRCITTVLTGEAFFSVLEDVDTPTFQTGLEQAERAVDTLLNMIGARLGLDHNRVLGSRYSFPLMARYLVQRSGPLIDHQERDKLLYWYIHTFLWGRYASSTESALNQDLHLIEEPGGALDRLIDQLRQNRGDLRAHSNDFSGWSRGARFYPLLYMITRVCRARDWGTGLELSSQLLGKLNQLQIHHIFPKARLYEHEYTRPEVNAIANFTFLTQESNLYFSDRKPADYFEEVRGKHPGALESHWIPMDRNLWKVENYLDFLAARRELLAQAANNFLESLLAGEVPEAQLAPTPLDQRMRVPGGVEGDEEEQLIRDCNAWVVEQGLPEGEMMYELIDPATGEPQAILDLAWPNGLQEGYSQPVALLIDESREIEEIVNRARYLYFTDVDAFRRYVQQEILAVEGNRNGA